jgi:hypothetical protein
MFGRRIIANLGEMKSKKFRVVNSWRLGCSVPLLLLHFPCGDSVRYSATDYQI